MSKFTALKNIAWAICIVICLLALLVGLVMAMTKGYYGVTQRPEVELGEGGLSASGKKTDSGSSEDNSELTYALGGSELLTVPETADGGQDYLNRLTFLVDSSLIGLRDYGLLAGGKDTMQVWATHSGSLPFGEINETSIEYPSDKSAQTVETALSLAKPEILVIAVGTDGLAGLDQATFMSAYRTLINSVWAVSPESKIICCSNCSVIANYTGSDGLTATMMSDANDWIQAVCAESGCYYADIGYPLGDGSGNMFSSYASSNGKTLNSTGVNLVLDYLRTHSIS